MHPILSVVTMDAAEGFVGAHRLGPVTVSRVQPYQAHKIYRCPGCNQEIPPRVGHLVVVPDAHPDDRQHWHHACWPMRHRRRPGR